MMKCFNFSWKWWNAMTFFKWWKSCFRRDNWMLLHSLSISTSLTALTFFSKQFFKLKLQLSNFAFCFFNDEENVTCELIWKLLSTYFWKLFLLNLSLNDFCFFFTFLLLNSTKFFFFRYMTFGYFGFLCFVYWCKGDDGNRM